LRARSNSNGSWQLPPTGHVNDDWGPAPGDQPYRVQVLVASNAVKNLTVNVRFQANSGFPYTETTGFDDNHDGILNDRPIGIGLRSLRGAPQSQIDVRVIYNVQKSGPAPNTPPRYRMNISVSLQNVTNRQNLGGYSG